MSYNYKEFGSLIIPASETLLDIIKCIDNKYNAI